VDVDFDGIRERVDGHRFWLSYLDRALMPLSPIGIHVAIFSEPFLTHLLEGRKTMESRFSRFRCAPFGQVVQGDVILVKRVAGPICGLSLVKRTWFFDLAYESLEGLRTQYAASICASDDFWESRRGTSYATLIQLEETTSIEPLRCGKRDRRGWVSLRSRQMRVPF
jgi:hypothetical protein